MSEFAYFRFLSLRMLTSEEEEHKDEIIKLTEEVLDSKGIECDAKISKLSEAILSQILEEVRKLRKKRLSKIAKSEDSESEIEQYSEGDMEPQYIR
jgi:hypothetical protein